MLGFVAAFLVISAVHSEPPEIEQIVAQFDRMGEHELWPGFDPLAVPLAITDDEQTMFVRHPSPPPEAGGTDEGATWVVMEGRHPSIVANSSAEIGGVLTATASVSPDSPATRSAGLLIHEAFHVFQRTRHPSWSANEADLFSYPSADPELLTLRRLESETLARALSSPGKAGCWAGQALELRRDRFSRMAPAAAEYERRTELNEGLATWVEHRATGEPVAPLLDGRTFAPSEIRQRGYASGAALAELLERFHPEWSDELESDDTLFLDLMLANAIGEHDLGACELPPERRAAIATEAAADIGKLQSDRDRKRRAFLDAPGFRIVIATEQPWFPQGFDPLNVELVAPDEVLHTRFVRLASNDATLEVLGRPTLTRSAGSHPLFEGISRITITGLDNRPSIVTNEAVLTITTPGVTLTIPGGSARETPEGIIID